MDVGHISPGLVHPLLEWSTSEWGSFMIYRASSPHTPLTAFCGIFQSQEATFSPASRVSLTLRPKLVKGELLAYSNSRVSTEA